MSDPKEGLGSAVVDGMRGDFSGCAPWMLFVLVVLVGFAVVVLTADPIEIPQDERTVEPMEVGR